MRSKPSQNDLGAIIHSVLAGDSRLTLKEVFDKTYRDIRRHNYPRSRESKDLIEVINKGGALHMSMEDGLLTGSRGWVQRTHPDTPNKETVMRISLNVYPESELIPKLDSFCKKHGLTYKVPNTLERWAERHDTVTIYLHKSPSKKMLGELKKIVSPHVRAHNLVGEEVEEGITIESEPTQETIHAQIERAKKVGGKKFGEAIEKLATKPLGFLAMITRKGAGVLDLDNPPEELRLSAGEAEAIKRMTDAYETYKQGHPPPRRSHKPRPESGNLER